MANRQLEAEHGKLPSTRIAAKVHVSSAVLDLLAEHHLLREWDQTDRRAIACAIERLLEILVTLEGNAVTGKLSVELYVGVHVRRPIDMTLMQQNTRADRSLALSSAAEDFCWYAKSLLCAGSYISDRELWLDAHYKSPRLKELFIQQKAAVGAGTTQDSVWAQPLVPYKLLSEGFLSSLTPFSAFDRLLNDGAFMRVPLKTRIAIATAGSTGSTVGEGSSKPAARMTFAGLTLEPQKAVSFLVVSDELARNAQPSAVALLGQELARAVGINTDQTFLSAIAASAGVTHAATGTTASAFLFDLSSALQAIQLGANFKVYFIAGADVIKRLSMTLAVTGSPTVQLSVTGGTLAGIRFAVSDAASDVGYLIDASQVAADSDVIVLDRSTEASVQLDSAPSTPPGGTLTSLWQMDMVGLRSERTFGVQLLRATGAACISGMSTTA